MVGVRVQPGWESSTVVCLLLPRQESNVPTVCPGREEEPSAQVHREESQGVKGRRCR